MQASPQSTLSAPTIFESWLPMDSESSIKGNCNVRTRSCGGTGPNSGFPRPPLGFRPADHNQDDLRSSSQPSEPILRRRAGRCAEHGADLAREFDLAIGLMDQRDAGINPAVGRHRVLRVSGCIQHLDTRAQPQDLIGELWTVESAAED